MKIIINKHEPKGGAKSLFSVSREDGKLLIDDTGTLSMVYYGYSEAEAKTFYEEQQSKNNIKWY